MTPTTDPDHMVAGLRRRLTAVLERLGATAEATEDRSQVARAGP
jgi:hypothetical protein